MNRFTICLLFALIACKDNKVVEEPAVSPDRLNNELWTWSDSYAVSIGWTEGFYFSSNGKFRHTQAYSGGMYWVKGREGKYQYDTTTNTILLTIDNTSFLSKKQHSENDTTDSLKILAITDSTVIIDRGPISRRGHDTTRTTTFKRQQNMLLLMIPEGAYHYEPEQILIQKPDGDILMDKNAADFNRIIGIINAAEYHKQWNDGRMLKMPAPQYTIQITCNGDSRLSFRLWQSGVMETTHTWYTVDYARLAEILENY